MKRPLVRRLILWIGLPLLAVYSVVAVTSYFQNKKASVDRTNAYLLELIRHQAARLEARFSAFSRTPEIVAETIEGMRGLSEERLAEMMERRLSSDPDIFAMAVSFESGTLDPRKEAVSVRVFRSIGGVERVKPVADSSFGTADWYLIPKLLQAPYWTEPYFSAGGGNELACAFSQPFYLRGAFAGVVTADISLVELEKNLRDLDVLSGYAFILGRSGTFIAHPNPDFVLRESPFSLAETLSRPDLRALGKDMIAGRQGIVSLADIQNGDESRMVYTPIPSTGWSFAAVIPEDRVLAPVRAQLYRQIVLMAVGLSVIFLGIVVTSYGITNPLRKLTSFAGEISAGRLEARVEGIRRRDEIQRLAEVFNKMVSDLNQYIKDFAAATKAKEAVESELRIARQIQESLLPRVFPPFPDRSEFDLYAKNAAAKDVAGDFYDFFFLDEDRLAVLIADVSGKGVPAALFMAVNRTLMKTVCRKDVGPAASIRAANEILSRDNDACMFTTMFLAVFNVKTGEILYANAGHNPPFVVSPDGTVRVLPSIGDAFLGLEAEAEYHEGRDRLEPGDLLVLYTDGVTEAVSPGGSFFGEERFVRLISDSRDEDLAAVWNRLSSALDDFQQGVQFDDITVVLLKRT